ncbi:hypothetical protein TNCV_1927121 [Trichonephila clavipes]|nr:hypothetical protein TNCV_1927121 [Trichonephila clavipes]
MWERCIAVNKSRIEAFTAGFPHTNTILTTAEIESGLVAKDDLVPFRCSPVSLCAAPLQTETSMGCHEPGPSVDDISRIHWSQHLLTTQLERPNRRATHPADHPASIMPMILSLSNCDSCSYCLRKRRNGMSTSALPL